MTDSPFSGLASGAPALWTDVMAAERGGISYKLTVAEVLRSAPSGNVALGALALATISTGINNVAVGQNALKLNVNASHNTAVGLDAMAATNGAASVFNTAVGAGALQSNTTGHDNTILGGHAALDAVDCDYTVALGVDTMRFHVSGDGNTAVGTSSGEQNVDGAGNTFVGWESGKLGTHGQYNVFLGFRAGKYETGDFRLHIDTLDRGNEADSRTKALIYGVFNATVANQEIAFNVGKHGFFGQAAVAKPTGVAVTAEAIHAALVTLNLIAP